MCSCGGSEKRDAFRDILRALENPTANKLHLSGISFWEIATLFELGRILAMEESARGPGEIEALNAGTTPGPSAPSSTCPRPWRPGGPRRLPRLSKTVRGPCPLR